MEQVNSYEAYHISDDRYQEGMILNTERINRSFDDNEYKKQIEREAECARVNLDSNLPSRKHCLFVCKKEDVRYWFNYIEKRRNKQCFIYKIKLDGNLLWTYADYLSNDKYEEYWHPSVELKFREHEGLFVGDYTIISKCNIEEFPEIL